MNDNWLQIKLLSILNLQHPVPFHPPPPPLEARTRRWHHSNQPRRPGNWNRGTLRSMQLDPRIWLQGCLHLIILSSYLLLHGIYSCNSLPQVAAGCQHSGPRNQQIFLNRWSRPHRSAKLLNWTPCLSQSSPHAPTGLQGPSQVAPQVTQQL